MENYIVINGKRAELTPEQLKALGIVTEKPNPFKRVKGEGYCYIADYGNVKLDRDTDTTIVDSGRFNCANYCTDRDLMQQRAYCETLNRLLWRYSMEHDGDKINWGTGVRQKKFYIVRDGSKFVTTWGYYRLHMFVPYFISQGVAEAAINEIIKPFIESHPNFEF